MNTISVIICTYNGEKYIEEQLNSLKRQSIFIDEYIICDDNSLDNTCNIIENYIKKNPELNINLFRNSKNKGVIKNFEFGLKQASGDYIAFCDQDDVWLPNKMELSLNKIQEMEEKYGKNMPLLVHTDLVVVDENLDIINQSFFKQEGLNVYKDENILKALFLQNNLVGCTMFFNKIAKNLSLPFPEHIIMHDYWLGLVVACKGKIEFINQGTIKYRQHKKNVVGAKTYISINSLKKIFNKNYLDKSINSVIIQNRELVNYKSGILVKNNNWFIEALKAIEENNIIRMIKLGIHKHGILRNIIVYVYFMIRKFDL